MAKNNWSEKSKVPKWLQEKIDEHLFKIEPKKYCMPDEVNTKEEHEEYLKAIGYKKRYRNI